MSFALEPEIVTLAWIDNASVQFPLNIYATKGSTKCFDKGFRQRLCDTVFGTWDSDDAPDAREDRRDALSYSYGGLNSEDAKTPS